MLMQSKFSMFSFNHQKGLKMTTQTKTDKAEEYFPYLMVMAMIVPLVLMAMLKSVLAPAENLKEQNLPAVDNSSNSVPSWAYDGRPLCLENKVYVLFKTHCLTDGTGRTGLHGVEPCWANSGFRIRPVFADGKHEQCTTQISAPEIAVFRLQSEFDNAPIGAALEQKMAEKLEEKNLHVRR
jgi:hypothetical protein